MSAQETEWAGGIRLILRIGCLVIFGPGHGKLRIRKRPTTWAAYFMPLYHLFRDAFGVERLGSDYGRGGYGSQQLLMDRVASHLAQHMGDIPVVRGGCTRNQ